MAPTPVCCPAAVLRAKSCRVVKRLIGLLVLAVLVPYAFADEARFSEWMRSEAFDVFYASKAGNVYPVVVEAKPLLGDGVVFRAMFIAKPSHHFRFESVYGISDRHFENIQAKLTSKGFVLIHHQKVMLIGGWSHQATWVAQ